MRKVGVIGRNTVCFKGEEYLDYIPMYISFMYYYREKGLGVGERGSDFIRWGYSILKLSF